MGKKKKRGEMERKTFSRGLCGAEERLVSSPCHAPMARGRKGEVVLEFGGGSAPTPAAVFQVLPFNWQFCEQ